MKMQLEKSFGVDFSMLIVKLTHQMGSSSVVVAAVIAAIIAAAIVVATTVIADVIALSQYSNNSAITAQQQHGLTTHFAILKNVHNLFAKGLGRVCCAAFLFLGIRIIKDVCIIRQKITTTIKMRIIKKANTKPTDRAIKNAIFFSYFEKPLC